MKLKELCMRNMGKIKNIVSVVFKWSWMISVFVILCLLLHINYDMWLDSDVSAELILSYQLNKEGAIFTPNWYYSSELRVLNTQLVFAPLFSVFTDWHVIRLVGTMILYGILLLSYFYFCRQAELSHICPWTMPILLIPFSYEYWRFTLVGAFYIPYMVIIFGLLGLVLHGLHKKYIWKCLLLLGTASGISFLVGMAGMRMILLFYIPLFLCAFILWFMKSFIPIKSCSGDIRTWHLRFLVTASVITCFAGMGCVYNSKILSQIYTFRHFDSINYQKFSFDTLTILISGFFETLGYRGNGNIFSINLLYNVTSGLMILTVILSFAYLLGKHEKLNCYNQIVVIFSACSFVVFNVFYLLTNQSFRNRYLIPVLFSALPVVGIFFLELPWKRQSKKIICILFAILITISSFIYMSQKGSEKYAGTLKSIGNRLVEKGYYRGYATFWNANVLTELTDGQIEVYAFSDQAEDVSGLDEVWGWLQLKDHLENPPHGKLFVIFSKDELESLTLAQALEGSEIFYQNAYRTVYVYDSYEVLMNCVQEGIERLER